MGFKIGEVVRIKTGDGRPHKIVDIKPYLPLNSNEHTFFGFFFEDGACEFFENVMEYYRGDYKGHNNG